jgi:hypothetical protein
MTPVLIRIWRWLDRDIDARWHWPVLALGAIALTVMVLKGWA